MPNSLAVVSASALLLCSGLAAQATWTVSDSSALQDAMNRAAPGDVIQLAPGGFFEGNFTLTQGVTVMGHGFIGGLFWSVTVQVPAGQIAEFVDVVFGSSLADPSDPNRGTLSASGMVRFQDCILHGGLRLHDAHAVLQRCRAEAPWFSEGIRASNSDVVITDCVVGGGDAFERSLGSGGASAGVRCTGVGSLHVTSCHIRGGDGLQTFGGWWPAKGAVDTSVPTWITDSVLAGGDMIHIGGLPDFEGGPALMGTTASYARCTLTGGAGTPSGPPTAGHVVHESTLLGATSSSLLNGGTFAMRLIADRPNVPIAVVTSTMIAGPYSVPLLAQPQWLTGAPFWVVGGTTMSSNDIGFAFRIPADSALVGQSFDFVGYRIGNAGFESTPVFGGVVR